MGFLAQIFLWSLKDNELTGMAFIDTQLYIHQMIRWGQRSSRVTRGQRAPGSSGVKGHLESWLGGGGTAGPAF